MSLAASLSEAHRLDGSRLTRLRRVSGVAPSPCGTWLAVAVMRLDAEESRYITNLWRVWLSGDDPARPPEQLTRGNSNDTNPRFRSDGSLAFLSNRNPRDGEPKEGDTQRNQVWLLPMTGGEPRPITDEPLGVMDFRFARDTGELFVIAEVLLGIPEDRQRVHAADQAKRGPSGLHYTTTPVRHWDYWLPAAAPHLIAYIGDERRDLTPVADREHRELSFGVEWDVSPDGSKAVIASMRRGPDRNPDTALRLIYTATGDHVDLGLVPGITHTSPRFAPDSAAIACVRHVRTHGRAETARLWLFEAEDMEPRQPQEHERPGQARGGDGHAVAESWDAWPSLYGFTDDGKALITTSPARGDVPVYRVDVRTGEVLRLSAASAGGSHEGLTISGNTVVGLRHRLMHPPEPFCLPIQADAEPRLVAQLSGFNAADAAQIATWESFTVPVQDGGEVQSFLVMPVDGARPCPALLWIHGGPVSQFADGWHWRWNPLVAASAGYAVILPNPRGSTGVDQEFIQGIWNNQWGAACYRDLMTVTDAVAARPEIDGEHMAAMGGSFGGYMANWIAVSTERFRCLVSHAGIFAMSAFACTTDYPSYMHYEMGVNPYEDPVAFDTYSPHRFIDRWRTPTLIIHGEKDYRVSVHEALTLFDALDWRGVEAELLIFPDENHWIRRPQNIRMWYRTVLEFLGKHLMLD